MENISSNKEITVVDFSECSKTFEYLGINIPSQGTENIMRVNNFRKEYLINKYDSSYQIQISLKDIKDPSFLSITLCYDDETSLLNVVSLERTKFGVNSKIIFSRDYSQISLENVFNVDLLQDELKTKIVTDYVNLCYSYWDYKVPTDRIDERYTNLRKTGEKIYYQESFRVEDQQFFHSDSVYTISREMPPKTILIGSLENLGDVNKKLGELNHNYQKIYLRAINYLGNDLLTNFQIKKLLAMTECPVIDYLDYFNCVPKSYIKR